MIILTEPGRINRPRLFADALRATEAAEIGGGKESWLCRKGKSQNYLIYNATGGFLVEFAVI